MQPAGRTALIMPSMSSPPSVRIAGVAIWGPGLPGWEQSQGVLTGKTPLDLSSQEPPPPPSILSPNERRRTGIVARLALYAAEQAVAQSGLQPQTLRSIFASGNGDGMLLHGILETLTTTENASDVQLSPTQFHNSVHNAPAGYWTIAHGASAPANCIGCHDHTFGAGLLKAVVEAGIEKEPVLLCLYDAPLASPLAEKRRTECAFAAAFVLTPDQEAGQGDDAGRLSVNFSAGEADPALIAPDLPALAALAEMNPAARSLRLLSLLAGGNHGEAHAPLLSGHVRIRLS
ncbi:putative secreted protein [Granulibacter bethesdensis]|uniref:Secreted protein n=2 Tax=Granulibacter bethesdensis TaxID=364410 RepID=A0AAN0RBD8_9PROT|nr:putative secreted protein [Granulibacter bethesdensis]